MSARKPPQTRQAPTQQTIILPLATTAAGYAPVHYYYHPSHQLRSYYPHYEPRMYHGPTTACEYGGGSEYYPVESDSVTHAGYYQPQHQHYLPTARTADFFGFHGNSWTEPIFGEHYDTTNSFRNMGKNIIECGVGAGMVAAGMSSSVAAMNGVGKLMFVVPPAAAAPPLPGVDGGTAR